MKRTWTTFLATIRALTYLAALQIILLATPVDALRQKDCVEGPTVLVRVASHLFEVPLAYYPFVSGPDRRGMRPKYCAGEPEEVLEQPIESLRLHINTDHQQVVQDIHSEEIYGVQIDLSPSSVPNPVSRNRLNRIKDQILERRRRLEDLPRVGQFHGFALDGERPENFTYFIALPEGPKTPDGYPLTLWCQPPSSQEIPEGASPETKEAVEQARERGLGCTVQYAFSEDLTLRYRFKTGRYPLNSWAKLDANVRAFVKRLMVEG